jgi:hypothetical protein
MTVRFQHPSILVFPQLRGGFRELLFDAVLQENALVCGIFAGFRTAKP